MFFIWYFMQILAQFWVCAECWCIKILKNCTICNMNAFRCTTQIVSIYAHNTILFICITVHRTCCAIRVQLYVDCRYAHCTLYTHAYWLMLGVKKSTHTISVLLHVFLQVQVCRCVFMPACYDLNVCFARYNLYKRQVLAHLWRQD